MSQLGAHQLYLGGASGALSSPVGSMKAGCKVHAEGGARIF